MTASVLARWARGTVLAAAALVSFGAQAAYTSLTFFGDSLTDTGNLFLATGAPPSPPYAGGGFSNGPLWSDDLAVKMGFPAAGQPSFAGGSNYAWAGARTANGTVPPGVQVQVSAPGAGFWGSVPADPTGLYVLLAGGNDMRDARSAIQGSTLADQLGRNLAAATAVANLRLAVDAMASKGVKNLLVANLPDLGNTPEAAGLGLVAASRDASKRFNLALPALVTHAQGLGMNVTFFDLAGLADAVRTDALTNGGAVYGITNVQTPCAGFPGSTGISCDVSMFSDDLHPSARLHQIVADAAFAALQPVPEPSTLLTMAMGVAALAGWSRRRRQAVEA